MTLTNIDTQNALAHDDLSGGQIQNIAYWLENAPIAGAVASAFTSRLAANTAGINTTETVIVQAPLIAGTTLKVGSRIVATLYGTCTDTVANTSTFTLRAGTLGSISDQSLGTFVTAVSGTTGTNVAFALTLDLVVTSVGATGTASGTATLVTATAGITGATLTTFAPLALTNLATTTATFFEVTAKTAAVTTTNTFLAGSNITVYP